MTKNYLVSYAFYHNDLNDPDGCVKNLHIQTALVWAHDCREAEQELLDTFADNVIYVVKTEVV